VPSPISTCSPTTQNGPTVTPRPSFAPGWTAADGLMPAPRSEVWSARKLVLAYEGGHVRLGDQFSVDQGAPVHFDQPGALCGQVDLEP